jgi:predicted dehydrogenase
MTKAVCVGFVGAGNVLPAYLQLLDRLAPRGAATQGPIHVRRADAAAEICARRPGAQVVTRVEDVLESDDVELVVILTPPAAHSELVRAALDAGRHVLCEKPLAATAAEAEALFDHARSRARMLVAAPFVHLSPSFRHLWTLVNDGALGHVHAARAHYGNPGSTWASWYHEDELATLGDVGTYNLKSLVTLLGPVVEVHAAAGVATAERTIRGRVVPARDPDTWHLLLRHKSGALASVLASHATVGYRRPAIELYGTEGTANLLGDDWDPHGVELWREGERTWTVHMPEDTTWTWTDGLRDAIMALRAGRAPLADPAIDIHVLDIIGAAGRAAREGVAVAVTSTCAPFTALRYEPRRGAHVHDRTRAADEQ